MAEIPHANRLMQGELGQWLTGQNPLRWQAKEDANKRLKTALLIGIPLAAFVMFQYGFITLLWVGGFFGALAYGWTQAPIREAQKHIKTGINEAIAAALGLTYSHDVDGGREFALAKAYKLVPNHDDEHFEDLWTGDYAGHPFTLHEAHLQEWQGSGKRRRKVTVFRGAIIAIGFARKFHGVTLVSRKGTHKAFLGLMGRKETFKADGNVLDYVDMVHPDFEDTFEVYSNDPVEARYLVHPEYVERLLTMETAFRGDKVTSLFHEGELIITIESGNQFESGSVNPEDDHRLTAITIDQFTALGELAQGLQEAPR